MKKIVAGSMIASMLIVPAMAQDVSVYLNNERMVFDQNPIIENGRTLVPLRSIFEGLGAEVKWNPELQEIKGITSSKEIVLNVGETWAKVNGVPVQLDVPAKIENGRTLVPLRFISETLDAEVKWDAENFRIDIDNTEPKYYEMGFDLDSELNWVTKNDKHGYLDKDGNEVVPCIYDVISSFSEGVAFAKRDGVMGYVDKKGNEVIPFTYTSAGEFREGLAGVSKDGKAGYIDINGNEVIPLKYDSVDVFYNEIACVQKDGKWGAIDKEDNLIIPFEYDIPFRFDKDGIASMMKKDGKWGHIDKTGKEIIPFIYDWISYSGDFAIAQKDSLWGVLDRTGKEILPAIYSNIEISEDGVILAEKDGQIYQFDTYGNIL